MNTFVPYPDYSESATVLDNKRLNKQVLECAQILKAALHLSRGWRNHPATLMWIGHEGALVDYTMAMERERLRRGMKPHGAVTALAETGEDFGGYLIQTILTPPWVGDDRVHSSHRANLLRKDGIWYGGFGWTETPRLGYFWPVDKNGNLR